MSSHQAAYALFSGLFSNDSGATGLNNASSVSNLFGGFVRRGSKNETLQLPRIEFEIASEREQDAMSTDRLDLVIRLHLFTDKNLAFGSEAGNQNSIATRMRAVFHMVTPGSAQQGWNANQIYRVSGQQVPDDGTRAHYVETYLLRLSA